MINIGTLGIILYKKAVCFKQIFNQRMYAFPDLSYPEYIIILSKYWRVFVTTFYTPMFE